MTSALRRLSLLAILLLAGCGGGPERTNQNGAGLPPVPAGMVRLFLYRDFEPYQSLAWVPVFLNRTETGAVGPGKVLFRDVAPGTYTIEAKSEGLWSDQAKTVTLAAGQTVYAKIESFNGLNPIANQPELQTTFVVVLVAPETARHEIERLWLETRRVPALSPA